VTLVVEELRFLVRGGTAANLAAVNEVPLQRELIVERDTLRMKLGDGVTAYNALAYISSGGGAGAAEMRVEDGYIQFRVSATAAWQNVIAVAELQGEDGPPGPIGPPGPSSSAYFGGAFDGGNVDITPGAYCDVRIPWGCTLTKASLIGNAIGDLVVDVQVASFASYPPLGADSIVGANPPAILGAITWEDDALAGWDVELPTGSVVRFFVIACAGVGKATVLLEGIRT